MYSVNRPQKKKKEFLPRWLIFTRHEHLWTHMSQRKGLDVTDSICTQAEKILQKQALTDFAPGENHINFRKDGVTYYNPNLFHNASTICDSKRGEYLPMLVRDILKVKDPRKLYQNEGYQAATEGICMFKNWPLQNISIQGRIRDERCIEPLSKDTRTPKRSAYILSLNDSSTDRSIPVKVDVIYYRLSQLSLKRDKGILLRASGHIHFLRGRSQPIIELLADRIEVIGKKQELFKETSWWKDALEKRSRLLNIPWIFKPFKDNSEFWSSQAVDAFNRYLIRNWQSNSIKIIDLMSDETLGHDLSGSMENETLYKPILQQFSNIRLIKLIDDSTIGLKKFGRLFYYMHNIIKLLTMNQQLEIDKRLKNGDNSQMIYFSLDIGKLNNEVCKMFNIVRIPGDLLNDITRWIVANERDNTEQKYIGFNWSYDCKSNMWKYI